MLEGLNVPGPNRPCVVARKAADLDEKDRKILEEALENPRWSTNALRMALIERGFSISDTALRGHRTRSCSCARTA